jgi:tight adherence protein B
VLLPIVGLIFLTVFCTCVAISLGMADRQASPRSELKRRLRQMAKQGANEMPEGLRAEIIREAGPLERFLSQLRLTRNLDKKLDQAGLKLSATTFTLGVLLTSIAAAALTVLATKTPVGLLAAAIPAPLGLGFLRLKIQQRTEKFTELFPETLSMIARSLRAGHSFTTAIQLVGQEIPNPVGELFRVAYDQQQLGLRMTDSLNNLNDRIDSLDLRFFTTVVSINSEIGGNFSEILDSLAATIRERLKIRRQVRVYTAQGRMSGYVLGALPVIAFFVFNILNPDYESVLLKEPLGIYALGLAFCLQLLGLLVIKSIIKIKI